MDGKQTNGVGQDVAPAAQVLVGRMSAAHAEVHAYALEELERIEAKIERVKAAIVEQRNRSQHESQVYIETVDRALRAAGELDRAVDNIAATLAPPSEVQSSAEH